MIIEQAPTLRRIFYRALESKDHGLFGKALRTSDAAVLVLSSFLIVLASDLVSYGRYRFYFDSAETLAVVWMLLIYGLRLWSCVENTTSTLSHPWRARWQYALTMRSVLTLIAVLPFFITDNLNNFDFFRLLRLVLLLYYTPALEVLLSVLKSERRALGAAAAVMLVLVILVASLMHTIEGLLQPEQFGTIAQSMWWAVVTLATVGYGDFVPITDTGRLLGGLTILIGYAMFGIPAGIIASGFSAEIKKRNFAINWEMVARVPLFQGLDAHSIFRITQLLQARLVTADEEIVRKGDEAIHMFLIAQGEVVVEIKPPVTLSAGDFFGEIALTTQGYRTATVRAKTDGRLLTMSRTDLDHLAQQHPAMMEHLRQVAQKRLNQ